MEKELDGNLIEETAELDSLLSDDIELEDNNFLEESITLNREIPIGSGDSLSFNTINKISSKEKTDIFFVIGPVSCGKTTFITMLYQLFQESPVDAIFFAGSKTLQGFEERSFFTRINSGGSEPTTSRTPWEANHTFLHLRLLDRKIGQISNMILSDLAGEEFEGCIGRIDLIREKFSYVKYTKSIWGILDGEKIKNKRTRESVKSELIGMLNSFVSADVIDENTVLFVIISKFDMLMSEKGIDEILEKIKERFNMELSQYFREIKYFNVAAMPNSGEGLQMGYGVKEVLHECLKSKPRDRKRYRTNSFNNKSEYDKLALKLLGDGME